MESDLDFDGKRDFVVAEVVSANYGEARAQNRGGHSRA
jgi:hypothetical protein